MVSVRLGERLRLLPLLVDGCLVLAMRGESVVGYGKVVVVRREFLLIGFHVSSSYMMNCVNTHLIIKPADNRTTGFRARII